MVRDNVQEVIRLADRAMLCLEDCLSGFLVDLDQTVANVDMNLPLLTYLVQRLCVVGGAEDLLLRDIEVLFIADAVAIPVVVSKIEDLLRSALKRSSWLREDSIASLEVMDNTACLHCILHIEYCDNRVALVLESFRHSLR